MSRLPPTRAGAPPPDSHQTLTLRTPSQAKPTRTWSELGLPSCAVCIRKAPYGSSPAPPRPNRLRRPGQFTLFPRPCRGRSLENMGADEGLPRIDTTVFTCPYCGLPQERAATLDHDWVMLEPGIQPPAHTVPAQHRWITLPDGRVTVYEVCPPVTEQRCRVAHELACPARELPNLWPWLTALREENKRASKRRDEPDPPAALPAAG